MNKKFVLLGQVVAKALHDGRVLDIPFSKAFYKLILGKVWFCFLYNLMLIFYAIWF